jgi:hypothetical protein
VGRETGGREGEMINPGYAASLMMLWSFVCLVCVVHIFYVELLTYRLGVVVEKRLIANWNSTDQTVSPEDSGSLRWPRCKERWKEGKERTSTCGALTKLIVGFASVLRSCSTLLPTVNAVAEDFRDLNLDKYVAYDAQR